MSFIIDVLQILFHIKVTNANKKRRKVYSRWHNQKIYFMKKISAIFHDEMIVWTRKLIRVWSSVSRKQNGLLQTALVYEWEENIEICIIRKSSIFIRQFTTNSNSLSAVWKMIIVTRCQMYSVIIILNSFFCLYLLCMTS